MFHCPLQQWSVQSLALTRHPLPSGNFDGQFVIKAQIKPSGLGGLRSESLLLGSERIFYVSSNR